MIWVFSLLDGSIHSISKEEIAARLAPNYEDICIYFVADLVA